MKRTIAVLLMLVLTLGLFACLSACGSKDKGAPAADDKVYTFEFWDTLRGEPVRLQDVRVRQGVAEISIPPFARDIAAKIHRAKEEEPGASPL